MTEVAVGIDVGGTSTRALVVDAGGRVLGRGESGGGNPNSHPPDVAAERIAAAVAAALGEHTAVGCVLGMAGSSKLTDPVVAAVFDAKLGRLRPRVVTDAEVAFASGTAAEDGTVLIAGTGSIAMRIVGRRRAETVGGFGWLLGDEGSAFWIGREAVRATLRQLQAGGPPGPLAAAVVAAAFEGPDNAFARLITAVNGEPPVRLARFAPLVTAVDDPVAADIRERAAQTLADLAVAAHVDGPVVLTGAVLGTAVGDRVRELLSDYEVLAARDGVVGAAWLAAVDAFGDDAARPSGDGSGDAGVA
ncbi:N-acetylglucosamine kinase [Actinokineospora iranica]|uniref:BadF-type ATPase n=1 Tax=Actinokineospora iranica TaxID=1271860 RepID=A0A1G6T9N5_9PSEU|nr:BadF/BadG/BcrA/BcrD ATPase family protein [Actinokineospora iranica]SDD25778.1 BadF-type ATPase [Actinokineospora iranica]